jgi:hypothetical protein
MVHRPLYRRDVLRLVRVRPPSSFDGIREFRDIFFSAAIFSVLLHFVTPGDHAPYQCASTEAQSMRCNIKANDYIAS